MPTYDGGRRYQRRVRLARHLCVAVFAALGSLFWYIQIIKHPIYEYASQHNSIRTIPLRAERGLILDRDGRVLATNRPSFKLLLRKSNCGKRMGNADEIIRAVSRWVPFEKEEALARIASLACAPRHATALVAEDLTLEELARVEARSLELPEIEIEETLVRYSPNGALGAHLLGYVGQASKRQLKAKTFRGCSPGDIVGKSGIELAYDELLRGRAGWKKILVNNRGRVLGTAEEPRFAVRGKDLILTIDYDLMAVAEKALGDERGAVVALDPRTGEVLVLLSRPEFDPNMFYTRASRSRWAEVTHQDDHPLFNRAIQAREPPGSVFKLVLAAAGLETGVATPGRTTVCNGHTRIHGMNFACWRAAGHGEVDLYGALVHSCNVFFYHLGKDIGISDIARYARMFGLGRRAGIDLPQENPGLIPDPEWKKRRFGEIWYKGETISVAIGQGAVAVTPLQVADLTAAIANRGKVFKPHLLKKVMDTRNGTLSETRPEVLFDVKLKPSTFETVRKGMWGVVNDKGTGRLAGVGADAFVVAGKTGTAQVASQRGERGGPREHAWFTGFAPFDRPEIVVSVLVEHAGHGGEAAAPVAGAVFKAYYEKYVLKAGKDVLAARMVADGGGGPAGTSPRETE